MANRGIAALGGAASGAGLGAQIGGPIGAGIGGAIGGLGGLIFGGGGGPAYPELVLSPETLASLNYGDINLEQMNPAMYEEILRNQALIREAERLMRSRGTGNSAAEENQLRGDMREVVERVAGMGLAGTKTGEAIVADYSAKLRQQLEEQAFREGLAAQQNYGAALGQSAGLTQNALAMTMKQLADERGHSFDLDRARAGQDLGKYQAAREDEMAKNQFWSGLFNNGMSAIGNYAAMDNQSRALGGRGYQPLYKTWAGV